MTYNSILASRVCLSSLMSFFRALPQRFRFKGSSKRECSVFRAMASQRKVPETLWIRGWGFAAEDLHHRLWGLGVGG